MTGIHRYSNNQQPEKFNVTKLNDGFKNYGNSGAATIRMAAEGGASRIVLLGFDCQHTGGKAHWHSDHPRGMGNAHGADKWIGKFRQMAEELTEIEIINCSRETALTCWPRANLEDVLC